MSRTCDKCGGEIIFRTGDHGRVIPIHISGGCAGDGAGDPVRLDRFEKSCWPTSCPICAAPVYFIRHNGGSVWVDDLGSPWDKHACLYNAGTLRVEPSESPSPIRSGRIAGRVVEVIEGLASKDSEFVGIVVVWSNKTCMTYRMNPRYDFPPGSRVEFRSIDGPATVRNCRGTACISDGPILNRDFDLTLDQLAEYLERGRAWNVPGDLWLVRRPKRPKVAALPSPKSSKAQSGARAAQSRPTEECPHCGENVKVSRLQRHVAERCPVARGLRVDESARARCNGCGAVMLRSRLPAHLEKRCPNRPRR
jgi:ssDNA-binding Zn-finger/Zn-ribbon topoisomerase 1